MAPNADFLAQVKQQFPEPGGQVVVVRYHWGRRLGKFCRCTKILFTLHLSRLGF
jgi:hypothetical protein